ncbi:50S ribosomal protein L11 methyltransferase [Amaricoccus solimangrovi]|uniref:Ribosomal protein L11 methyltransferase n=1 Tax=Amaricoccus solimangrovi TaxID=2589815 RepID=A0A501X0C7_9RHOB|nr:50S ribosomal protein L11 methyltransferase [Amaricoccus solimangrovi]TPE53777.1 50S ribosomal protein L11 methyltransferase [Amaricoccus solimangrovi]
MPLYYASTVLKGEDAARALGDALESLDPLATEVRDHDDGSGRWDVGAHFDGRPDAAGLALVAALHGAPDFAVSKVEERDWIAQVRSELTPVEAGRFVVYGAHDRDAVPTNRVRLEIEAAQAFGTGHHASTQGCLTALDRLARAGLVARRVADIGGGTGVLAMAAVSIWPARAIASDIDPVATLTARENAAANGLGPDILCLTAPGFNHPVLAARAPFDLVFANILAAPLKRLAPAMARHQAPGGVAILSGLLTRQAPGVRAVYEGWGYRRIDRVVIGEWTTLVLRRG